MPYGKIGRNLEIFIPGHLARGANIAWRELLRLLNASLLVWRRGVMFGQAKGFHENIDDIVKHFFYLHD